MKRIWISIIVILCSQIAQAATYYVNQSGSGDADGSSYANSMSVATHNSATFTGDDIIRLCDTITSSVIPPSSGTEGHPIVYDEDAEHPCTIDGFTEVTAWTDDGDGTYSRTGITSCAFLQEDGVLLTNASSSALSDGNWYLDGTTLHYKPSSGVDTDHTVKRQSLTYGMNLANKSYITIDGIDFTGCEHGVGAYQSSAASSGIVVSGITATQCLDGVLFSAANAETWTGNQVRNSTFTNCGSGIKIDARVSSGDISTGVHTGYTLSGNTFTNSGYGNSATDDWNSLIAGSIDKECIGAQNLQSSSIYSNTMGGNSRGIFLYTRAQGSTLDNSIYWNNLNGLTGNAMMIMGNMAGTEVSGNAVYSNLFANNTGDFTLWFSNVTSPTTDKNYIYGNIFDNFKIGLYCPGNGSPEYWDIKNNSLSNAATRYIHIGGTPTNIEFDYNLFDSADGSKWVWNSVAVTLVNWKSQSSQDANSVTGDPKYYNPDLHDFRVHSDGAGVEKGTDLGATYQRDYYGHWQGDNGAAWDIGTIWFDHKPTIQ